MDELELDLDTEAQPNKTEERIKNLSSKVKEQAARTEEEREAREASDARASAAEKERDFYASFSDQTAKYPGASEYKDQIKEKVLAGYSVDDATVAVLAAEGKFTPQQVETAPAPPGSAAGGSAPTTLPSSGDKTLADMSRDDKRAEVMKAIERGDIFLS